MWECNNCRKENKDDCFDCWNCSMTKSMALTDFTLAQKSEASPDRIVAEVWKTESPKPKPIAKVTEDEQGKFAINPSAFDSRILIPIGIIIALVGVALIIISPSFICFSCL